MIGIELLVRNIPSSIKVASAYMKAEQNQINTLVLGASQNKRGINPEFLSVKTLNVAGTRQGHKTDYYLLKDLDAQLPRLKTVILACTYRHFESSPNSNNFWKYRSHLYYLKVNAFERQTYFKDELLFLGSTDFYSKQLKSYYIKRDPLTYNRFGFQTDTLKNRFVRWGYDDQKIKATYSPSYPPTDIKFLDNSVGWFNKVLAYCDKKGIDVIIALTPVYDHYQKGRDPEVLKRRDSILKSVQQRYSDIRIFDQERSQEYHIYDYMNENHLNPRGAKKFTKKLDEFISSSK